MVKTEAGGMMDIAEWLYSNAYRRLVLNYNVLDYMYHAEIIELGEDSFFGKGDTPEEALADAIEKM